MRPVGFTKPLSKRIRCVLPMDNVDDKIDTLMRDKLVSLMQENTVRIKNINIKYTTSNKKHTIERWRAFYDSFDKLFRNMPKDLVRVEKEVRSKFVQPDRKSVV